MNRLSEFWFLFGAALADESPTDLWRAKNDIDGAIATISGCTENQFLYDVLAHLRPHNELRDAVVQATIELYYDLTFSRAAEWGAAFDAGQIGG